MRVDFVITELFVGGAERCLTELALGLAAGGDEVRVFSLGPLPSGQQRRLVDRLEGAGIPVASGDLTSATQAYRAYRRLKSWSEQSPAEIVQTFLYHANVMGSWAAKKSGVPIRVAGLRVAERKPLRCLIERQALRHSQSVICVSAAVRRFAQQQLGCDQTTVIPNGVDVSRFVDSVPYRWSSLGWPEDALVSLFVGRLHPQKGLELIQEQIDRIAPQDSNQRLLIVGEGPLRDPLQSWANKIGPLRVQLMPWQPDIAPLMRACRMLLLPSHYEGMPNVILEAMAAGRPVVCSRVEGCEELLDHDLTRQSFPAGDGDAMWKLIEPLLSDRSLCDEIGRENQRMVQQKFSIDAMVDSYRSHYRSLLPLA